ncbi:MAG TPA: Xaa-Pro peptidase family protein [Terriglobales bacterium]|nr:Xaa-Pro peptidase family protein [Terriglobales bacterium]
MDYKGRQQRQRSTLAVHHLDALLVTHLPNILYLCGFSGSAGALLLTEAKSIFFSDGRYAAQARSEVRGAQIVIGPKAPLAAAADWLSTRGHKKTGRPPQFRLGIESERVTVAMRHRLAAKLPSHVRLRQAPELVERARQVKDAQEIQSIRAAVLLGASLFDRALAVIRPGVKENEVAAEMEYAARKAGAEAMSFPTIIASGKRSALPHGRASRAPVPARGFVVCDFGVILTDYCSDMTRTVHVGRPSAGERRAYQAVKEAQQAAVDSVGPGISVGEVDRAARKVLQNSGLENYFTHSTGHGVGLEIHEAPRVGAGQTEILQPGMVITIEPGVYLPGRWGVRIEDMVVVTERGCEVLTPTSKELIEI